MAKPTEQEILEFQRAQNESDRISLRRSTLSPPPGVAGHIAATNASTFGFAPKNPHYIPWYLEGKNTVGRTNTGGPYKGEVFISTGIPQLDNDIPNTLSHESYHQGAVMNGAPYENSSRGYKGLALRMLQLQPSTEDKPYWGTNPTKSRNEMLASIKGYEGSLPKGTSLAGTEVGKRLFNEGHGFDASGQERKNYYYNNISYPGGGFWEGQDDHNIPSNTTLMKEAIVNFLSRGWRNQQ